MYALTDYSYDLPEALIAQLPAAQRDRSRLLMMNRNTGALSHHAFYDLLEIMTAKDVLVVNNNEVIPARQYNL